jgi:peptidoglycan/xylan/chitin deacetylase (PgdA/CDA1 family)
MEHLGEDSPLKKPNPAHKDMRRSPKSMVILAYHSLDDSGSVISVSPQVFAEQMRILHELGMEVVPLSIIREVLGGASASKPLVAITFDDGFRNVYERGFRILQRYGFPATIFLVTDYCGKTNDWLGQPNWVKRQPLLGWTEVREMSMAGITFGSHTQTHPDLTMLPPPRVEEELLGSKRKIEDTIGSPVDTFAYPYGVYNDAVRNIVKVYFNLSCSTSLGFVSRQSDLFALERLDMYYLRRPMVFERLLSKEMDLYIHFRRGVRSLSNRVPKWLKGKASSSYGETSLPEG